MPVQGDNGEVGCGGACVGEPLPHQLGGDNTGQGQGTRRTTTEGGSDDTRRGAILLGQSAGDPRLLDHIDEETEREGSWFSPTFDLQ